MILTRTLQPHSVYRCGLGYQCAFFHGTALSKLSPKDHGVESAKLVTVLLFDKKKKKKLHVLDVQFTEESPPHRVYCT